MRRRQDEDMDWEQIGGRGEQAKEQALEQEQEMGNIHRLILQLREMQHFVSKLHGYVMGQLVHGMWYRLVTKLQPPPPPPPPPPPQIVPIKRQSYEMVDGLAGHTPPKQTPPKQTPLKTSLKTSSRAEGGGGCKKGVRLVRCGI
jgi:hypothetical protein